MQPKKVVYLNMMPDAFDLPGMLSGGTTSSTTTPPPSTSSGIDIGDVESILGDLSSIFGKPKSNTNYPMPPPGYYYNQYGQLLPIPGTQNKTTGVIIAVVVAAAALLLIVLISRKKKR